VEIINQNEGLKKGIQPILKANKDMYFNNQCLYSVLCICVISLFV